MSEFVKKTMMGYKEVPGGQSDPECTHVILMKAEYAEFQRKVSLADQRANTAKYEADREIDAIKKAAAIKIHQTEQDAQRNIESIQNELEAERAECVRQIGLNANLIRIFKERNNAERNLRPKKEHTGYVVVMSTEKEYRYKVDRRNLGSVVLWETVLQSPYSVELTEDQARMLMDELIGESAEKEWLISKIGINASYDGNYEEMLTKSGWTDQQRAEFNIMLTRKLRANYRAGYWELVFLHTKPLGLVPKDMRA